MILSKQQIEEIESRLGNYWSHEPIKNLLETVKDLQSREQRARELLEAARDYLRHSPNCPYPHRDCDCEAPELFLKIEEHLK